MFEQVQAAAAQPRLEGLGPCFRHPVIHKRPLVKVKQALRLPCHLGRRRQVPLTVQPGCVLEQKERIHPNKTRIQTDPAFAQNNRLFVSQQLAKPVQGGGKRLLGHIAV